MIRTDANIATSVHVTGTSNPRLVVMLKASNDEWAMEGQLSFTNLGTTTIDQIEDELVRRLHGRCTLSVGPAHTFDIMTNTKIGPALSSFCKDWGLTTKDMARKSGLEESTVKDCLSKEGKTRSHTRRVIASTIDRIDQHPTIGEYLRHRRLQAGYHSTVAARFLDTDEKTVLKWERDEDEVPVRCRWVMMNMYGITNDIWNKTTPTVRDIMAPVTATSPMEWGAGSRDKLEATEGT